MVDASITAHPSVKRLFCGLGAYGRKGDNYSIVRRSLTQQAATSNRKLLVLPMLSQYVGRNRGKKKRVKNLTF